jgi:hypothetical protein
MPESPTPADLAWNNLPDTLRAHPGIKALYHAVATQRQPIVPGYAASSMAFTEEHAGYIKRYGGRCRDCADENGVCPSSGLPCGGADKAIRHVLGALAYGVNHGFVSRPVVAPHPSAQPAEPKERKPPAIKGAWIDGGYVIVTPAGSGPDKAPAVKAAILAHFGIQEQPKESKE